MFRLSRHWVFILFVFCNSVALARTYEKINTPYPFMKVVGESQDYTYLVDKASGTMTVLSHRDKAAVIAQFNAGKEPKSLGIVNGKAFFFSPATREFSIFDEKTRAVILQKKLLLDQIFGSQNHPVVIGEMLYLTKQIIKPEEEGKLIAINMVTFAIEDVINVDKKPSEPVLIDGKIFVAGTKNSELDIFTPATAKLQVLNTCSFPMQPKVIGDRVFLLCGTSELRVLTSQDGVYKIAHRSQHPSFWGSLMWAHEHLMTVNFWKWNEVTKFAELDPKTGAVLKEGEAWGPFNFIQDGFLIFADVPMFNDEARAYWVDSADVSGKRKSHPFSHPHAYSIADQPYFVIAQRSHDYGDIALVWPKQNIVKRFFGPVIGESVTVLPKTPYVIAKTDFKGTVKVLDTRKQGNKEVCVETFHMPGHLPIWVGGHTLLTFSNEGTYAVDFSDLKGSDSNGIPF